MYRPEEYYGEEHNGYTPAVLKNTIGQYVWTTVRFCLNKYFTNLELYPTEGSWDSLPDSERAALKELIKAAKYMDPIWNRSVQG